MIVEDHPIFREGLRHILEAWNGAQVSAMFGSVREALPFVLMDKPDLVVVDLGLPGEGGISMIRKARQAGSTSRFLVVTSFDGDEDIYQALAAGASGYLPKDAATSELIQAVQAVSAGKRYLPTEVRDELAASLPRPDLTERERDVLHFLAQGLKNRRIAEHLRISELTVKVHVQNLIAKLEARDRTHALRVALERGFIHFDDPWPRV